MIFFRAINPKKGKRSSAKNKEEEEADVLDVFGENPNWDPGWVKAHKINYLGQASWDNFLILFIKNINLHWI